MSRKQQLSATTATAPHLIPAAAVALPALRASFTVQHVETREGKKRRAPDPDWERDSGGGDRAASWADVGERD